MAIIRKDYLLAGDHVWIIGFGELPSAGGPGLFCKNCGIGPMISGRHGKCPETPSE